MRGHKIVGPTARLRLDTIERVQPVHVDLVYRTTGPGVDGIRDHGAMLCQALGNVDGVTAAVHDLRTQDHPRDLVSVISAAPRSSRHAMVLQYQGFSYARWAWAPWLVRALWRVRRALPNTTIVLLAHELYVPLDGPRNVVLGVPQRAQFAALRGISDVVLTTTETLAKRAGGIGRAPAGLLPVGSNLPDRRPSRTDARHGLGIDDDELVLGLFGTGHPSRMFALLDTSVARLARGRQLVVLNIGAGAPRLRVGRGVILHEPGERDAAELAEYLSAADLLLLPFTDGASTRRTTLMAGLQHAIPVLTTDGPSTGTLLRSSSAVALVPIDRATDAFAARAEVLLDSPRLRRDLAQAGRALYETNFAWPVLARGLLAHIDAHTANKMILAASPTTT